MSLKIAILASVVGAAAARECQSIDAEAAADCITRLKQGGADVEKKCDYYKSFYACYPKCYCDGAEKGPLQARMDESKATLTTDCELTCGAGTALAPGLAMAVAAAVVVAKLM